MDGATDTTTAGQLEALVGELSEAVRDCDPADQVDSISRKKIANAAQKILTAVKEPEQTAIDYSVFMAEMAALRFLMAIKALDNIPDNGTISYKDLAAKVGAEESLVTRMAWMLVATGMLNQVGEDQIAHTRFSKLYAGKTPHGMFFQVLFDVQMVPSAHWPEYFRKYGYKEPVSITHTPHSFGWGQEDKPIWEIIGQDPESLEDFHIGMSRIDEVVALAGSMFDFSWIMKNATSIAEDRPLIVDVGGGKGQSLKQVMSQCPEIPASRLVLQDRPDVLEHVRALDEPELRAVTKMPHDFFQEQPIKGALVYYIRRCLHDYSDENCLVVVSHLAQAMAPSSRVLITEQIMSNPPSRLSAQHDLCMLNISGKERTKDNWLKVASSAGLKVVKFWTKQGTEVGVIECEKGSGQ